MYSLPLLRPPQCDERNNDWPMACARTLAALRCHSRFDLCGASVNGRRVSICARLSEMRCTKVMGSTGLTCRTASGEQPTASQHNSDSSSLFDLREILTRRPKILWKLWCSFAIERRVTMESIRIVTPPASERKQGDRRNVSELPHCTMAWNLSEETFRLSPHGPIEGIEVGDGT
jgi:hypothetical protein